MLNPKIKLQPQNLCGRTTINETLMQYLKYQTKSHPLARHSTGERNVYKN